MRSQPPYAVWSRAPAPTPPLCDSRPFPRRQERIRTHGRSSRVSLDTADDSVYQVGRALAQELDLLCFDEFQVADVADALILRRLFAALWEAGVIVVATSNRQPERLYERGLNREYFAPFIPMLQGQCAVHPMESDTDHRQLCSPHADGARSFFVADSDSREDFETAVATLSTRSSLSKPRLMFFKNCCGY